MAFFSILIKNVAKIFFSMQLIKKERFATFFLFFINEVTWIMTDNASNTKMPPTIKSKSSFFTPTEKDANNGLTWLPHPSKILLKSRLNSKPERKWMNEWSWNSKPRSICYLTSNIPKQRKSLKKHLYRIWQNRVL